MISITSPKPKPDPCVSLFEFFFASVELAYNMEKVRASSPTKLTPEMTRLLALIQYEGYELFPARTDGRTED